MVRDDHTTGLVTSLNNPGSLLPVSIELLIIKLWIWITNRANFQLCISMHQYFLEMLTLTAKENPSMWCHNKDLMTSQWNCTYYLNNGSDPGPLVRSLLWLLLWLSLWWWKISVISPGRVKWECGIND